MPQRAIIGASKTGSISLQEARQAVRNATSGRLIAKSAGEKGSRSGSGETSSQRARERYLGHFGSGSTRTVAKRPGTAKASAEKSGAHNAARKSAGKKAGVRKAAKKSTARKVSRKAS
jgi:hypothetical protein